MADWATISALATGGGTLVLAGATFASVKSANRTARVAECAMLVNMRPVLVPSRPDVDPVERFGFGEAQHMEMPHPVEFHPQLRDLYHEGGQRTISRFGLATEEAEGDEWVCGVIRHWSVDGVNPR